MTTNINRVARRTALVVGSMVALASTAAAQNTRLVAGRWQAWVGCWQQVQDIPQDRAVTRIVRPLDAPIVCVAPGGNASSVDIVTVDSTKVLSRYSVDASGAARSVDRDGCVGTEKALWSRDSLRVFLRSDVTCANSLKRVSTGVMSIVGGEWLDAQSVVVATSNAVRTVRYQQTAAPKGLPADVAGVIANARRLDSETATIAAGAPLTAGAIAEAARVIDTAAVQAWLVERHDKMIVNAKVLTSMADAGVPGSITDVMVALANPDEFHFDHAQPLDDGMGGAGLSRADSARIAASYNWRRGADCDPFASYSPYGWGIDPCDAYRYGYNRYGYGSGYGYGYGYGDRYSGLGYGGYGGYYPGYYYSGPVVIVQNNTSEPHGRAVNGQGYTRGSSTSSGTSASRTEGSSGSSSTSSGSSSSGSSGSSSSSSGRTAHAKPPTSDK